VMRYANEVISQEWYEVYSDVWGRWVGAEQVAPNDFVPWYVASGPTVDLPHEPPSGTLFKIGVVSLVPFLRFGQLLWRGGSAIPVPGPQELGVEAPANAGRLVHLTDEAGRAGIGSSQQIIGRHGIFAVPESVAAESTAMKVVRTGLTPARTAQAVPIPDAAVPLFQRPVPIGPYSGWKYLGGVQYASPGSISTATGAFTPSATIIGPNMLIYGPDALFYGGVGAAGGIYWYGTSGQE